jgi:hypothetical protein
MGFLRRLVGGTKSPPSGIQEWPAPGPITTWPVGESFSSKFPAVVFLPRPLATVEVSGVSDCQEILGLMAGGRTLDGTGRPDHVAILLPEPSNANDPSAIRVVIIPTKAGQTWGKVGYLSPENAVRYLPVIDRVASIGKVTACHVSLKGGSSAAGGGYTVTLHLDVPENLMLELDKALGS